MKIRASQKFLFAHEFQLQRSIIWAIEEDIKYLYNWQYLNLQKESKLYSQNKCSIYNNSAIFFQISFLGITLAMSEFVRATSADCGHKIFMHKSADLYCGSQL